MSAEFPSPITDSGGPSGSCHLSPSHAARRFSVSVGSLAVAESYSSAESASAAVIELLSSAAEVLDPMVAADHLSEINRFLSSSVPNQLAIDAISLDLPRVVAKLGTASEQCHEIAACVIRLLVSVCNPRDMLAILCEALDESKEEPLEPAYFVLLLDGLSVALVLIKRRQVEQLKVVLPVILRALSMSSLEYKVEEKHSLDLFMSAIRIGISLKEIFHTMVEEMKEEIRAVLGLYVLQNIVEYRDLLFSVQLFALLYVKN